VVAALRDCLTSVPLGGGACCGGSQRREADLQRLEDVMCRWGGAAGGDNEHGEQGGFAVKLDVQAICNHIGLRDPQAVKCTQDSTILMHTHGNVCQWCWTAENQALATTGCCLNQGYSSTG
jgi:hypothetical protein